MGHFFAIFGHFEQFSNKVFKNKLDPHSSHCLPEFSVKYFPKIPQLARVMSDFRPHNSLFLAQKFEHRNFFFEKVLRGANASGLVKSWDPNKVRTETRDQYLSNRKKVPKTDPPVLTPPRFSEVAQSRLEPHPRAGEGGGGSAPSAPMNLLSQALLLP